MFSFLLRQIFKSPAVQLEETLCGLNAGPVSTWRSHVITKHTFRNHLGDVSAASYCMVDVPSVN